MRLTTIWPLMSGPTTSLLIWILSLKIVLKSNQSWQVLWKIFANYEKGKADKYTQPSNVEMLQVTQINRLIWGLLQQPIRISDTILQKMQLLNIKAITAITLLLNDNLVT